MDGPRRFKIDPPDADPLVRDTLTAAGWEQTEADDWTLLWSVGEPDAPVYAQLQPRQLVNHLPGIVSLARKDLLPGTLERGLGLLHEPPPPFVPETYLLPAELGRFRARAAEAPEALWIQKPRAAARGEGIALLDVDELETGSNWLVQRYLDRPHLIGGRKYTLRWYVLVTGLDPLAVWIFSDGFAKLASRAYDLGARGDRFRHLTNPDVQAENSEVETSADNLTFDDYAEVMRAEGHDPDALFAKIERVVGSTVAAARDELARTAWRSTNNPGGCFELLGLDVLVDDELRPWLLECNLNPSLSVEAEGETRSSRDERELKSALLREVFRRVGLVEAEPGARTFRPVDVAPFLPLPRPGEGIPRVLRAAEGVASLALGDSVVLHDPQAQRAHVLDPVAAYLWAAWGEGLAPDEIAAEVGEALPEAAWRAEADLRNALGEWLELGLAVDPDAQLRPAAPAAARPRLLWNRERVYRCVDTVLSVTCPSEEIEGWLDVSLGPLADDEAGEVDLHAEVVPARGGWEVVTAAERLPFTSVRQVGSIVRALLLREAVAPDAFGATLLAHGEHGLLLVGAAGVRAPLARSLIRDGAACVGDELVRLRPGAVVEGHRAGVETLTGPTWWGDLPGLAASSPLLIASNGFAQMWWPEVDARLVARPAILRVEAPSMPGALLAAAPLTPEDAFRDLLGARPGDGRISRDAVCNAVELVQAVPAFSVLVPDTGVGLALLSAVPALW